MPAGIFIVLLGYLLGSVPTGILLTRLFSGVDPRKLGSKNIGAANIYRTAGKALGILTLMGDMLKGVIPVEMAILWTPHDLWGIPGLWIAIAGLSPIVGHLFPVFLGFKGGKGVATALGVYLWISPVAVAIEALIFIFVIWRWRIISLGSIICATTIPVFLAFWSDSPAYFVLSLIVAALILYRHQANIERLLHGTENRWKA